MLHTLWENGNGVFLTYGHFNDSSRLTLSVRNPHFVGGTPFTATILCGLIFGYTTCFAYAIWFNGGYSPTPAWISCYSGFDPDTKTAVSNGCAQWNGAGKGALVYKLPTDHNNTTYPSSNQADQITKGNRGSSNYCMQTAATATSCPFPFTKTYLTEVDIDVIIDYLWSNSTPCPADRLDIGDCIAHELGHLCGLAHSTAINPKATMTEPAVLGSTERRSIEQDDVNVNR